MKKNFEKFVGLFMAVVAAILGVGGDVMMAAAADLPDAGKTEGGTGAGEATTAGGGRVETSSVNIEGIATETFGRKEGDKDMYLNDVDQRIVKIRPMATPLDNISRYAKNSASDSFVVKYYSTGTRPIKTTLTAKVDKQSNGSSVAITCSDNSIFTLDDTIRVVGTKGRSIDGVDVFTKYATEWSAYCTKNSISQPSTATEAQKNAFLMTLSSVPELELCVCGRDSSSSKPIVYAVNGYIDSSTNQPTLVPEIANGSTLVRMGKACGELDVQTGRFNNLPTSEYNYCQNFMIQVEQSTFDKIAAKEVNWGFSDIEEDSVFDMRLAQENSFLFGVKGKINHVTKDNATTWFTEGIWHMAANDLPIGTYDESAGTTVITDDDLVDFSKDLFVGTGVGNKRKVLFCGSNLLAALSKIKSEKFRLKDTVEAWNLRFKSWETDFGEILTIHHELFDVNGMSDYGFALDPEYLSKKTHLSWARNVLDLKKAGTRNTDAVVIQEIACLYLRYGKAHARVHLAGAND